MYIYIYIYKDIIYFPFVLGSGFYLKNMVFIVKLYHSPTDAQLNCPKRILKFTLKLILKQLRHVSV